MALIIACMKGCDSTCGATRGNEISDLMISEFTFCWKGDEKVLRGETDRIIESTKQYFSDTYCFL